jgi:hypothetical protein
MSPSAPRSPSVRAQAHEDRVADAAVRRPFGEAHLAHEARLDPVIHAAVRPRRAERRVLAGQRLQLTPQLILHGVVKAAADARDVAQLAVLVHADVKRAEAPPAALRIGVAADHEFLPALALDLDPVGGALPRVRAVAALGDDPFEPHLVRGFEKRLAMIRDVVAGVDHAGRRHRAGEALLAIEQPEPAQVVALERQAVEEHRPHRDARHHRRDVARPREQHALLQAAEARAPRLVVRHDLAVEHDLLHAEPAQRLRDLGIARRDVLAAAAQHAHVVAAALGDHADAVVLDLEHPALARERLLGQRGEHVFHLLGAQIAARRLQCGDVRAQRGEPGGDVAHLLHGEPRDHRARPALVSLHVRRRAVHLLQQQPVLLTLAHAHQRPPSAELVPEQLQLELAARVLLAYVLGLERAVRAPVPHDHGPGAVVAGRDHALEVCVLERMVLDVHREPLLLRAHRRPLRHRPALEHALHFETQVEVQVARPVLLHHETRGRRRGRRGGRRGGAGGGRAAERLRRAIGVALAAVRFERRGRRVGGALRGAARSRFGLRWFAGAAGG